MTYPLRVFSPDHYYHLYSRGNNKQTLFLCPEDYCVFLRCVLKALSKHNVEILKYVLMPNHFHMLIRPDKGDVSKFMQSVKLAYAMYFSEQYLTVGHVWQGRFGCRLIESDADLQSCGEYIENNPVRAGLCIEARQWCFSSAGSSGTLSKQRELQAL